MGDDRLDALTKALDRKDAAIVDWMNEVAVRDARIRDLEAERDAVQKWSDIRGMFIDAGSRALLDMTKQRDEAWAERDELQTRIDAALALHEGDGLGDGDWCKTCGLYSGWPCPTVAALAAGRGTPTEDR